MLLLAIANATAASTGKSLTIAVYSNGYVLVTQSLVVDSKATSVQVALVSPAVSNLVATDQNGSPLSYGFSSGNLTVYTLGASGVTLSYDTDTLTSKNGTVWTLAFTYDSGSTVVLPQFASLTSVSGAPSSINQTGGSFVLQLGPGSWKVSYGVPLEASTSTTGTGTSPGTGGGPPGSVGGLSEVQVEVGGSALAVAAASLILWRWRRGGIGPVSKDLRPDDLKVLNFIQEKGGRVLEPEIRMKFALPKTSAWRQIKRLERMGYVKVAKIGSQNQIELLRDRNQGD